MNTSDIEKEIREHWFKDHKATYTQYGDIKVLEWGKPGSGFYYVRYVFDRNKMYVSGDLGEAVFVFTETVDVYIQGTYSLGYFESKLRAYHEARRDFDEEKARKRLREWLKDLKENGIKYDHDSMKDLFSELTDCMTSDGWAFVVNMHSGFISELEPDYFEWMYSIGDKIPSRVHGYLMGFKMASEQLRATESEEYVS